jgi:hypothetical protein
MHYYWKFAYDVATTEQGKPVTLRGGSMVYKRLLEGRFNSAHLPVSAWPYRTTSDLDMHGWIDSEMVCDALKSSAFPVDPTKAIPRP